MVVNTEVLAVLYGKLSQIFAKFKFGHNYGFFSQARYPQMTPYLTLF